MSTKAYAIKLRNDLPAGVLQVLDLKPNTSQRNLIYEGEGKTGYIRADMSADASSVSSAQTALANAAGTFNHTSAEVTGLVAYLMERVEEDDQDAAGNGYLKALTLKNAVRTAQLIIIDVMGGVDIDAARIAVHLTAVVGQQTDLIGTNGNSYGAVEDVVKILAGHTYTLADNTILSGEAGGAGEFLDATAKGTAVSTDATGTYSSAGSFSSVNEKLAFQGTAFSNSLSSGNLSQYTSATFAISNAKTVSGIKKVNYSYAMDEKEESSYSYSASAVVASTILPVQATITTSTVNATSVFTCSAAHNLSIGDSVWLVNHDGTLARTGSATGAYTVAAASFSATEFSLEDADGAIECTVALTTGSVVLTDGTARHSIPKSTAVVGTNRSAVVGVHAAVRYVDEDGVILG